jgi:hypothetical protein
MWWRRKMNRTKGQVLRCSFCNRVQDDVRKLIAGPKVFICDGCVGVCSKIIADDTRLAKKTANRKVEGTAGTAAPWPNRIQCALCRTPMLVNEGLLITGNRGILCAGCVDAVAESPRRTH